MKPRDLATYLVLALAWGASFVVVTHVVHGFGWAAAVSFRAFIAAGTLIVLAKVLRRRLDFSFGLWPLIVVGATTVAGQLVPLSYGLPLIGTAMSAILVSTIPLYSMIIARLWRVEYMSAAGALGVGLGIAGVMLLVGFPARPVTPDFILGSLATLVAALSAAVGSVYAGRNLKSAGAWETTIGAFLVGGVLTLPLIAVVPVPGLPSAFDVLMLAVTGILMSAMTYVLYFRLIASVGPTRAISVEFAVTGVAVLTGTLLLGEPMSLPQVAGAVIIGLGCALVLGLVPLRRKRPAEAA